jgi:hypothetical protein
MATTTDSPDMSVLGSFKAAGVALTLRVGGLTAAVSGLVMTGLTDSPVLGIATTVGGLIAAGIGSHLSIRCNL